MFRDCIEEADRHFSIAPSGCERVKITNVFSQMAERSLSTPECYQFKSGANAIKLISRYNYDMFVLRQSDWLIFYY